MPDTTDPAASALQPIRDRAGIVAKLGPPRPGDDLAGAAHRSAADVPRLLKAAEAALKRHRPVIRKQGHPAMCEWDNRRWPCPEVADIAAALTENDSAPAGAVKEDGGP